MRLKLIVSYCTEIVMFYSIKKHLSKVSFRENNKIKKRSDNSKIVVSQHNSEQEITAWKCNEKNWSIP